jgi:CBS domain containing-hemolysin-like protein
VPNERGYDTLGGFVMAELARVPTAGQHFDYAGWRFQVISMDGHRVERVLAVDRTPLPAS